MKRKKINKILLSTIIAMIVILVGYNLMNNINIVSAYDFEQESGLGNTVEGTGHKELGMFNGKDSLDQSIGKIITVVISFVGVIFLVMGIYAGFLYMTAGGNQEKIGKAIALLIAVRDGLVVVLIGYGLAYLLIRLFAAKTLLQ